MRKAHRENRMNSTSMFEDMEASHMVGSDSVSIEFAVGCLEQIISEKSFHSHVIVAGSLLEGV